MSIALAAVLWQFADLISWSPALARNPSGELWFAALTSPDRAIIAKLIGIVAVAVGLVVLRHHRWWFRLAAGIAAWGAFGAATNIWAFTH